MRVLSDGFPGDLSLGSADQLIVLVVEWQMQCASPSLSSADGLLLSHKPLQAFNHEVLDENCAPRASPCHPWQLLLHSGPWQPQALPLCGPPLLVTLSLKPGTRCCRGSWVSVSAGGCFQSGAAVVCTAPSLLGAQSQSLCVCVRTCVHACVRVQPQPDLWGTAQLPVVAAWQALCGHVAVSPSYLCGPPLGMAVFLVWWVDIYCGESRIYLVLGSSVLSKQAVPPTSSRAVLHHQCGLWDPIICCLWDINLKPKDTKRLKVKEWKKIHRVNNNWEIM